jgi:hypothetical protein
MDLTEIVCEGVNYVLLTHNKASRVGFCECGNETWGSMKEGTFLYWLGDHKLFK